MSGGHPSPSGRLSFSFSVDGVRTRLISVALEAAGVASLTELDPEARAAVQVASADLDDLLRQLGRGVDVARELAIVRAEVLLWAWTGAAEVRAAWARFLDVLGESARDAVAAAVFGAAAAVFAA